MTETPTIEQFETANTYLAHSIKLLETRLDGLELFHVNTLDTALLWGTIFGIFVGILAGIAGVIVTILLFQIKKIDDKIEKEVLRAVNSASFVKDSDDLVDKQE